MPPDSDILLRATAFAILVGAVFAIVATAIVAASYAAVNDAPQCPHTAEEARAITATAPNATPLVRSVAGCEDHADTLDIASLVTGDVLTVSYRGLRSYFSAAAYRSVWTHTGLVWRNPATNEPFVLEASIYRPPYIGRIIRVPLLHWVRINRNSRAVALTQLRPPADAEAVSAAYKRVEDADVGVENIRPHWIRFTSTKTRDDLPDESFYAPAHRRRVPSRKSRVTFNPITELLWSPTANDSFDYVLTCHEILIGVLQEAGVVPPDPTPCSYLPYVFANNSIPTTSGYKFLPSRNVDLASVFVSGML